MSTQFQRAYSLIVAGEKTGKDLSTLRFRFSVDTADVETPNTAIIRIYNPSSDTAKSIVKREFTTVILQAGYVDGSNYGQIFKGEIKRARIGRERNVDSFIEIMAAEGDFLYNFGFVNTTTAPNSTPQDRVAAIADATQTKVQKDMSSAFGATGGILPRGTVLFGLTRTLLRDESLTAFNRWSIQDGAITFVPMSSYLPGEVLVLDSQHGLIGTPEVTDNGINVRCLINPKLRIGGLVKINQDLINKEIVFTQGFPSYTSLSFPTQTAANNTYRVLAVNYVGDTRGNDWYADVIALDVDLSAVAGETSNDYPQGAA